MWTKKNVVLGSLLNNVRNKVFTVFPQKSNEAILLLSTHVDLFPKCQALISPVRKRLGVIESRIASLPFQGTTEPSGSFTKWFDVP